METAFKGKLTVQHWICEKLKMNSKYFAFDHSNPLSDEPETIRYYIGREPYRDWGSPQ